MQDKTTCLETISAGTGLKISKKKTELMKINTTANTPLTVGGEPIREVDSFIYLGSAVDRQGGTDRDVTARIGKARVAFVMLKNIWSSKEIKIRSILLYGCETGGRQRQCYGKFRHSSTLVCGASTASDGQR